MSEEAKTKDALLAENQQRAAESLCEIAENVPDAVTDSWLHTAGCSSLSGTRHGQKLVRELMRVTLAHVAAPVVAEQWLIKAELENQRDARVAPPESQVRAAGPNLPDVLPFFDEQLDVQALLTEVEKAQEQDRPCAGGEPQMIDRLAHIIRTYRRMETRDGTYRIGVAPAGQPMDAITETSVWLGLTAECDKRIDAASVARWFRENGGPEELPKNVASVMPGFCRWVSRKAAFGLLEAVKKEHAREVDIRRDQEKLANEMIDRAEAAESALTALWQDIRSIVGPVDVTDADREAVTEADAANGPDAREYYAERKALLRVMRERIDEIKHAHVLLTNGGISSVASLAERIQFAMNALNHRARVRNQFETELSEIRDVLSKAGHTVDTHAQLMGCLLAIAGEDAPIEHEENQPSFWPQFSSFDTRVYMPLLAKLAEMIGQPHEHGQPNMEARQNRIIRLARAVQALATSHGISSTSAAIVDQGSFE